VNVWTSFAFFSFSFEKVVGVAVYFSLTVPVAPQRSVSVSSFPARRRAKPRPQLRETVLIHLAYQLPHPAWRPQVAGEDVSLLVVRLRLKYAWKDGTTHTRLAATHFVLRVVALIPLPRRATLHYHRVFAPASTWRPQIVLPTARPRLKVLPVPLTTDAVPECDRPKHALPPPPEVSRRSG